MTGQGKMRTDKDAFLRLLQDPVEPLENELFEGILPECKAFDGFDEETLNSPELLLQALRRKSILFECGDETPLSQLSGLLESDAEEILARNTNAKGQNALYIIAENLKNASLFLIKAGINVLFAGVMPMDEAVVFVYKLNIYLRYSEYEAVFAASENILDI